MFTRRVGLGLCAAVMLTLGGGCKKAAPGEDNSAKAPPPKPETIARIHWLGKERIGADTNAASFMDIWRQLETARLEAQTLDKLATAPWRLALAANTNSQAAAQLRPLLDDLVLSESYLEVAQATNQPGELVLALRLNELRAGVWETNLAAVLESLTGIRPSAAAAGQRGWELKLPGALENKGSGGLLSPALSPRGGEGDAPRATGTTAAQSSMQPATAGRTAGARNLELRRAGEWTLLGLAQGPNALLSEFGARIQRAQAPFAPSPARPWLEAEVDPRRVAAALALGCDLPAPTPRIAFAVVGGGDYVDTRGELDFPAPLAVQLEPWNIPTNSIPWPLSSFTALRGFGPWLASLKFVRELQLNTTPNQLFVWALPKQPILTFASVPMRWASPELARTAPRIAGELNPWITNNAYGSVSYSEEEKALTWGPLPIIAPTVQVTEGPDGEFLSLKLMKQSPPVSGSLAPDLLSRMNNNTNLVYVDHETTSERIQHWLFMSQLARVCCHRTQVPTNAASLAFLQASAPKLRHSATEVNLTGPATLSFSRRSSIGLTGIELNLFADWLESPDFPRGLHTTVAPPPRIFQKRPPMPKK